MAQHKRAVRWRRVTPLLAVAGFIALSAHSRIVSAEPRAGGEFGSYLNAVLNAVAAGDDIAPFTERGVSIHVRNAGTRRLVTVALRDDEGRCLLARSSQPGYVEYAALVTHRCSASEGVDASIEWAGNSGDVWD